MAGDGKPWRIVTLWRDRHYGNWGRNFVVAVMVVFCGAALWFGSAWVSDRDHTARDATARSGSPDALRKGDCFDNWTGNFKDSLERVELTDCEQPHQAELFGRFTIERDGGYPG